MACLFCIPELGQAHSGKTAYAIPLKNIIIDGSLDDWPEDIYSYPIGWISPVFHNPVPPQGPQDFSASFQAGFNPEENLLYVAVVVRDDDVITHPDNPGIRNQDVCGIYVDADHSGGDSENNGRQLYVMVPGPGKWAKRLDGNPSLNGGDTETSGMKGAYTNSGDTVIYEWEIPLFDVFPDQRHQIQEGEFIGFDILLADADGQEKANYVFWTPESSKSRSSDLFGNLVFIRGYENLGTITGTVTSVNEGSSPAGLIVEAYRDDHLITTMKTDPMGRYEVQILPGKYKVKVRRGQGIKSSEEMMLEVSEGQESRADLTTTLVELPEIFLRSMALYKSLKGYRDTITVSGCVVKPDMENGNTSKYMFAFEKPNRIRIEEISESPIGFDMFCNGEKMVTYTKGWKQYKKVEAPQVITTANFRNLGFGSFIVDHIILSDDPLRDLMKGVEGVREVGGEILDGRPTAIIEISQLASVSYGMMFQDRYKEDFLIPIRLWIGTHDHLIRKIARETDMDMNVTHMTEKEQSSMGDHFKGMKTSTIELHSAIEIDPVFSDRDFTFVPPEGSELVERFGPPVIPQKGPPYVGSVFGKPAPDFTLKDTDGNEAKLSDFKGKVVLLDFWATWCDPCIQAMPHLQLLHENFKEKDVVILGINSWERQKDKVMPFLKDHNITYRILLDSDNEVLGKYDVSRIPSFFILDKQGIIRYLYRGMPDDQLIIQEHLEELLAKQ